MSKADFVIRFSGLSDGVHNYHFEVNKTFFEQLDYSEIKDGKVRVDVAFEKKPTMNILNFNIKGEVEVMCDKCTDNFLIPVENSEELIYKYGDHTTFDEKIFYIPESEIEIDISHPVYELIVIALPSRRVHPEGKCNQDMLKAMDEYLMVAENEVESSSDDQTDKDDEVDPRWAALKKLKNKH